MSKYQYRISVGQNIIESDSPYGEEIHKIAIVTGAADENAAKHICETLNMEFIRSGKNIFGFTFTARCTENTSAFFWAGGKAA